MKTFYYLLLHWSIVITSTAGFFYIDPGFAYIGSGYFYTLPGFFYIG